MAAHTHVSDWCLCGHALTRHWNESRTCGVDGCRCVAFEWDGKRPRETGAESD